MRRRFIRASLGLGVATGLAFGLVGAVVTSSWAELGEEPLRAFEGGNAISADEVNENFARMESALRELETRLSASEALVDGVATELDDHYEEVSFEVSSSAVTYDASSEVSALRSIRFDGVRIGNTFYLGFTARFELTTQNNYVALAISLAGTPVTGGRSITSVAGTHVSDVNATGEATSPGRIVAGAVFPVSDPSSIGLEFVGQFKEVANRSLFGTLVVVTNPD